MSKKRKKTCLSHLFISEGNFGNGLGNYNGRSILSHSWVLPSQVHEVGAGDGLWLWLWLWGWTISSESHVGIPLPSTGQQEENLASNICSHCSLGVNNFSDWSGRARSDFLTLACLIWHCCCEGGRGVSDYNSQSPEEREKWHICAYFLTSFPDKTSFCVSAMFILPIIGPAGLGLSTKFNLNSFGGAALCLELKGLFLEEVMATSTLWAIRSCSLSVLGIDCDLNLRMTLLRFFYLHFPTHFPHVLFAYSCLMLTISCLHSYFLLQTFFPFMCCLTVST